MAKHSISLILTPQLGTGSSLKTFVLLEDLGESSVTYSTIKLIYIFKQIKQINNLGNQNDFRENNLIKHISLYLTLNLEKNWKRKKISKKYWVKNSATTENVVLSCLEIAANIKHKMGCKTDCQHSEFMATSTSETS